MLRHALWIAALTVIGAIPAQAGGHGHVVVAVNRPFFQPFFRPFFPRPFFPPVVVAPPIVVTPAPLIVPAPIAIYPPPPPPVAVYPPPPPPPGNLAYPEVPAQNCRQVQLSFILDGQPQSALGTVCQQPDGSWRLVG